MAIGGYIKKWSREVVSILVVVIWSPTNFQLASSQNKPFKWKPIAHTRDAAAAEPLNFADFCCGQMAPHYLSSSLIEVRRPAAASKHSLQGQNLGGKKKA